mgnify:CR=1 FL=1
MTKSPGPWRLSDALITEGHKKTIQQAISYLKENDWGHFIHSTNWDALKVVISGQLLAIAAAEKSCNKREAGGGGGGNGTDT